MQAGIPKPLPDLPKAVMLDMDGLLLDSETLSRACYRQALADFAEAGGVKLGDIATTADSHYVHLIGLNAEAQRQALAKILPTGIDLMGLDSHWRELFRTRIVTEVTAKAGATDLCRWLMEKNVPMAVATTTRSATARKMLAKTGLLDFMQAVIGGDQVKQGKPAPDLYLAAAQAVNQKPEDCLAFEDSPPGVAAAYNAGIPVVQVPDIIPANEATRTKAKLIADSLPGAARLLGWDIVLAK